MELHRRGFPGGLSGPGSPGQRGGAGPPSSTFWTGRTSARALRHRASGKPGPGAPRDPAAGGGGRDPAPEYHLGKESSYLWAVTPDAIESFELPPREDIEAEARRAAVLLAASSRALARRPAERALTELSTGSSHRWRIACIAGAPGRSFRMARSGPSRSPRCRTRRSAAAVDTPPLVVGTRSCILPSLSVLPPLRAAAAGRRPAPAPSPCSPILFSRPGPSGDAVRQSLLPEVSRSARSSGGPARADAVLRAPRREAILALVPPQEGSRLSVSRPAARPSSAAGWRAIGSSTSRRTRPRHRASRAFGHRALHGRPPGPAARRLLCVRGDLSLAPSADLVVLSACRTALGREIRGEGLIGLTRGFFSAGARQVLVSLWPVEDRATAELMRRFYRE